MNAADIPTELFADAVLKRGFRIVRTLGQGGMGRVYEAEDTSLKRRCALKQTFFTSEQEREWIRREAELLARLDYEHLPKVYDFFDEDGGYYLAMQFINGPTLRDISDKLGPLPPRAVLLVAEQLLLTLQHLHTQSSPIIHRDIKPENIKIRDKVFLLDFGLAKDMGTGTLVYGRSPGYSSPEQESGQRTDERSDIYSLGATLYSLLTALQPPVAMTRLRAISEDETDPLRPAQEVNPKVSGSLASVIHKAMALKPSDRYASAAEMRRALEGEGIEAIPANLESAGWAEVKLQFGGQDETLPLARTEPKAIRPRGALYALCGLIAITLATGMAYWAWSRQSESAAQRQDHDYSERVIRIDQQFEVTIHPSLPPHTFHVAGYGNTTSGVPIQVGISQKGSSKYTQFLTDLVVPTFMHPRFGAGELDTDFTAAQLFTFEDLNFDGYADMRFIYDSASVGLFDICWLFDKSKNTFERSEALTNIFDGYCDITIDAEVQDIIVKKCHTLHAIQSAPGNLPPITKQTYKWVDGELKLIRDTADEITITEGE